MTNEFSNFPPNLDDGELWLPSDIFFNEKTPSKFNPHILHRRHHRNHHHHRHGHPSTCTDDLAHRFAALSLPQHHQKPPKATNFERFKEQVRYGSVNGTGFETDPFLGGTKPVYALQFLKPTQAQVESYVEVRARVLQRQQNQLFQNRVLPCQANGFNYNNYKFGLGSGLVKKSGGTGVFHPRIVNNATFDSKNKQSLRIRESQEIQVSQRMMNSSMKRVDVMKQEDCYYHLPPEIGFA